MKKRILSVVAICLIAIMALSFFGCYYGYRDYNFSYAPSVVRGSFKVKDNDGTSFNVTIKKNDLTVSNYGKFNGEYEINKCTLIGYGDEADVSFELEKNNQSYSAKIVGLSENYTDRFLIW